MNVGDLVKMKKISTVVPARRRRVGIILEWYDTPKGMVTVGWWRHGKLDETNPCHVSKLEVINESKRT